MTTRLDISPAALAAARILRARRPANLIRFGALLRSLAAAAGCAEWEVLDASDRLSAGVDRERAGQEREGERRRQAARRALVVALDGALFDVAERAAGGPVRAA